MAVEGIPQRDVVVTFTAHFASYVPGDVACFLDSEAQDLTDKGVVGTGAPPTTVDTPAIAQFGDQLKCTVGNWTGTPSAYHYTWRIDGTPQGFNSDIYWVAPSDIGKTAVCNVTASNAFGSTVAPASNSVVIS